MPAAHLPSTGRNLVSIAARHGGRLIEFGIAIFAFIAFVVVVTVIPIAARGNIQGLTPAEQLQAEESLRAVLIQGLGGLALLLGAMYTARTYRLTSDRNVTNRFTKAVEQLGSDHVHVRIGGILALERIANESKRDYMPVMALLVAFVRDARDMDKALTNGMPPWGQTFTRRWQFLEGDDTASSRPTCYE